MNNYEFIKAISSWALNHNIPVIMLRPQFTNNDLNSSDLDILIKQSTLHSITEWMINQSIRIISFYERNDGITYYLQAEGSIIHVDFFYQLKIKGQAYLTPETVIQRAVTINDIVYADPVDQLVILLMTHGLKHRSIDKQKNYSDFIGQAIKNNRDSCLDSLITLFGASKGHTIFLELKDNGYSNAITKARTDFYRSMWKSHGLSFLYFYCHYYIYEMILRIKMPRYTIIFLGVDGSGKTTLIKNLLKPLKSYFLESYYFHLLPKLSDTKNIPIQAQNNNPHLKSHRSFFSSTIKIVIYCLRYYIVQFLPLKKPAIFLYDRHLCDMLADPVRFRVNPEHLKFLSFLIRLAPKPDAAIILNISASAARSRKQEVTFFETERQAIAYKNLAQHIDNAILINAEMNAEAVANIAIQHITNCLHKKAVFND